MSESTKGVKEKLHEAIAITFNRHFDIPENILDVAHGNLKYKVSYCKEDHMFNLVAGKEGKELVLRFKFSFSLKFYDIGLRKG